MSGIKIAIATQDDFKRLWRIYRAAKNLGYDFTQWELEEHFENCPLKLRRYIAVILGNLNYSGGFSRVLMGCEALIDNCCDKTQDVYDLNPEIKQGLSDTERLNWMIEHKGQFVTNETNVELRYAQNGMTRICSGAGSSPRDLIDSCMAQTANTPAGDAQ